MTTRHPTVADLADELAQLRGIRDAARALASAGAPVNHDRMACVYCGVLVGSHRPWCQWRRLVTALAPDREPPP